MAEKAIISLDRVRGMFIGAFLGDALGVPHEFKCNRNVEYTGKLEHRGFMITRFQGKKELEIGQISDDSEMTLTLLRSLISNHGYNRDQVVLSYLQWANSGGWMMGKNTRELLKGVTTVRGYQNRINKVLLLPMEQRSQSNGALMRSSPLALLSDLNPVVLDVNITNPNDVCIDCEIVYISALRLALQGLPRNEIFRKIKDLAQTAEVKTIMSEVENRTFRNISENKGWCLHALWCSLTVLNSDMNCSEAMKWIITSQKGSDTDTNACISGALLGAVSGFDNLNTESETKQNIEILLNVDTEKGPTPRPRKYTPYDFYDITLEAHKLTL